MSHHKSTVNFRNLIQDLADMYNFPIPEAVLTELIANALDADSNIIKINFDPLKKILVVEDNGKGMSEKQFSEYHDFAAGLKKRGSGIGFAGLGAKISFNEGYRVVTETWSSSFKGGSNWYLNSPKELLWEDTNVLKYLTHIGTRVEVFFNPESEISSYSEKEFESSILRHFLPLFDNKFLEIYSTINRYKGIKFYLNDKIINRFDIEEKFNLEKSKRFIIKSNKKRIGFGIFGLSSEEYPLDKNCAGIGISVYGKVVKFDLMNQFLGDITPRISGIVEVPPLIDFLNTSKTDFTRNRNTAKKFSQLYEPIRMQFKEWLKEIGVESKDAINTEDAIKLEQELKKIVKELPELTQLFGLSSIGTSLTKNPEGEVNADYISGIETTFPDGKGHYNGGEKIVDPGILEGEALALSKNGREKSSPISRKKKSGLRISFVNLPERPELGWVEGNLIVINSGHPSYQKIHKNILARKLHNIFSIAVSLDKELKDQNIIELQDSYISKLMGVWGKIK